MKTFYLLVVAIFAISLTSNAQFDAGTQVSVLTGHGGHDNHSTLVGVVVRGSFAVTDNTKIGTAVHIYSPKKTKYSDGNISYWATDNVTNISSTFDFLIAKKSNPVQPYIGVDLGISASTHNVEYLNDMNLMQKYNISQVYPMISPKMGMNVALGGLFGTFTQVQYNFSPGDGNPVTINLSNAKGVVRVLKTEPISKYFNIDTGIYMLIGNLRKK